MAFLNSDQMTSLLAAPPKRVQPNDLIGRVRIARWSFTVPAGGVPINDVIRLTKIPKGARIVGGREFHSAMSTGAGAATVEIGTYADDGVDTLLDVDAFLAATSVDAAGQTDIANTLVLGALDQLAQDVIVGAKATVEAWAAAGSFEGYLLYVTD